LRICYAASGFCIHAFAGFAGANQKREIIMRHLKLIAAALLVFALTACVGVIVPIPLPASTASQDDDRNERR